MERAILELVERDAAALWWLGDRPAAALDIAMLSEAAAALRHIRMSGQTRQTTLLDLTTDLGIAVVVALGTSADGGDLSIGLGCRPTLDEAARAAILELGQMEIGLLLAREKAAAGLPLEEGDRGHLARAALKIEMVIGGSAVAPQSTTEWARPIDPNALPGIEVALVEHSMPGANIAVVQALALDLQPVTVDVVRPRLRRYQTTRFPRSTVALM
ncbi:MAG TPA: YcaO-like family protein [Hyphomicrobiaceae bacterium]|nr:YcaO-like family protein [Hyphomicrobiaceae bacterium]